MTDADAAIVESARKEIGLAVNQMDFILTSEFCESEVAVARQLLRYYRGWRAQVLSHWPGEVPTSEAAYILCLSMWHMLQLVRHGEIVPSRSTGRQHYFDVLSVTELFNVNEHALEKPARRRGPLAQAFLAHLSRMGRMAGGKLTKRAS